PEIDMSAPAHGRKAVVYATCFVNYNDPQMGTDALEVLARNGVEMEVLHPSCCGMPKLEHGDIDGVAQKARRVAAAFRPYIEKGYDVVALTPSCSLMLKFEWPLILPDDEDVRRLSEATHDISQYVVDIARTEGLADGMKPLDGGVTVHLACHARAQNMGQKAAELLRLIPEMDVEVIERCSGHGGSWGMMKDNFETAIKVGRPAARRAVEYGKRYVVSECPLAGMHLLQGMEKIAGKESPAPQVPEQAPHPIQLLAQAYRS
ncbi:MAG: heterodisulfide reductase-related iron-sulfur binding cluster, partial [Rhodospirillaceae bacterium]